MLYFVVVVHRESYFNGLFIISGYDMYFVILRNVEQAFDLNIILNQFRCVVKDFSIFFFVMNKFKSI